MNRRNKKIISIRSDGIYLFDWYNLKISRLYSVYYGNDFIRKKHGNICEACDDAFTFRDFVNGRWYPLVFGKRYDKNIILYTK